MKPGLPGGRPPDRVPGLPSVHKARADRDRGRFSRASSAFWLWAASGLAVLLIGYRFVSGRELDGAKADLLAKQRAVEASVGSAWFPLRDRIESLVVHAAERPVPDAVDPETASWGFRTMPGLYLRLRLADARDVPSVRRASSSSQKDGFVGCLLREPNVAAARGDADAGAFAEQPWNWQKAYGATRILTDEWVAEVKNAPDPLRLKVFDEQYEKAVMSEIPLAIDLVRQAQFFLLVLDEDSDEAKAVAEGGIVSEAVLQRSPHYARVHLYDLRNGKEALSLRRSAEANFVFAGEHDATDPETLDAMKRQVNNCALAKEVDRAIVASASPR
jgi:hypothetical protein